MMYNPYYPENTSPDGFENYGGHHIDDRMKARGASYASHRSIDGKTHYATPEMLDEKRKELQSLEAQYAAMLSDAYGAEGRERLCGEELALALQPLEALSFKIRNLRRYIDTAIIIKEERRDDKVRLLSTVTVSVQGVETPMTLRIKEENEADPLKHEVSRVSPVGKALLGCRVGDTVDIRVGARTVRYKILSL